MLNAFWGTTPATLRRFRHGCLLSHTLAKQGAVSGKRRPEQTIYLILKFVAYTLLAASLTTCVPTGTAAQAFSPQRKKRSISVQRLHARTICCKPVRLRLARATLGVRSRAECVLTSTVALVATSASHARM